MFQGGVDSDTSPRTGGEESAGFTKDAEESHLCCIVLKPIQKHEQEILAAVVLGVGF